jgi:hypothetical protein
MKQELKIGDYYKNEANWEVKIIYFTDFEVCIEDKTASRNPNVKFLSIFSIGYFLRTFKQIEDNRK